MLHLREQAEQIHRSPFGQQYGDSDLTDLTLASSSENRQNMAQPAKECEKKEHCRDLSLHGRRVLVAAAGTVSIQPESGVQTPTTDAEERPSHPIRFVDVGKEVELQVIDTSDLEKEYSAYIVQSMSRISHDRKEGQAEKGNNAAV